MVSLISIAMFAIIFLLVVSIIGFTAPDNQDNIQELFDRINCPLPAISGLWNSSGVLQYTNGTYNYKSVNNNMPTLTCTQVHTLDGFDYFYGTIPVFEVSAVPFAGVPFFIGDFLSEIFANKVSAFFELIGFLLSPASLNILGFTIDDISGVTLTVIIGIYIMCYVAIGVFMYKTLSPFSGLG